MHPRYMIPDRLPWRLRARPSATLHEIQVHFPSDRKSGLVSIMLQNADACVKWKKEILPSPPAMGCLTLKAKNINHEGHEGSLRKPWPSNPRL
jgi:hypothetical protein